MTSTILAQNPDSLRYHIPPAEAGGWRVIKSTRSGTVLGLAHGIAGQLRVKSDIPRSESSIAPIFLNGALTNTRMRVRSAATFDELLAIVRPCLAIGLVDRLAHLKQQDKFLTEEQEPLSLDSAKLGILILINYDTSVEPDLFVTPSGHLQIEWRADAQHRLVAECKPDATIRFALVYELEQAAGSCPAASFVSKLQPYPVWKWFHGGR